MNTVNILIFKLNDIHGWVKNKLENENRKFDGGRNYVFYINQIFQDTEQSLKLFFELCDDFFAEIDISGD